MSLLRALLALSRVWHLPTVWSNCLAGWWLGGGENSERLFHVFGGATLLFLGGAFLNDAFDAGYDRQFRKTRPIPSGAIGLRTVWRCGLALMVAGALVLINLGRLPGALALALVFFIVLYNALHRFLRWSPVLMGITRLVLYLLGASVAAHGVTGWTIWGGLALAVYVTGVGCFRAPEGSRSTVPAWPSGLLAAPIGLALIMNAGRFREAALLLSAVLGLWTLRSLRHAYWSPQKDLATTRSALLAGIVFVDWLAAADSPRALGFWFIALFMTAIGLQALAGSKPEHSSPDAGAKLVSS